MWSSFYNACIPNLGTGAYLKNGVQTTNGIYYINDKKMNLPLNT